MRKFALVVTYAFIASAPFLMLKVELVFELLDSLTLSMLLAIGALRIGYGIVLSGAASTSRMPRTVRFLGVIFILAGIITPMIGVENIRALVDGFYQDDVWILRMGSVFALMMFGFIVYALAPRQDDANGVEQLIAAGTSGEIQ